MAAGFPLSSVWAPPLNHTCVFCRIDLHWTRSSKGLIKKWKRPFRNAFCSNYMIRNKVAASQCGSRRPRCHSWRSPSIKASMGGRLAPDNIFVIQPYHHHHHQSTFNLIFMFTKSFPLLNHLYSSHWSINMNKIITDEFEQHRIDRTLGHRYLGVIPFLTRLCASGHAWW